MTLQLTDFLDLATLQDIQDAFAAVAGVSASITDAQGRVLTQRTPTKAFIQRQRALQEAEDMVPEGPQREGREYVAPIWVKNQRLGTIRMTVNPSTAGVDDAKLQQIASRYGLDLRQLRGLASALARARGTTPSAIQFLFLLANAVARLCYQEYENRKRLDELEAVFHVATMLAESRELGRVLQRTVEVVCELMGVKAASIRLLDEEKDELVIRAVHNLSSQYLNKGAVSFSKSQIDQVALGPAGYEYVPEMAADPRVLYPQESQHEGIVSLLSVGMRYKGRVVGVLRLYTATRQEFSEHNIHLLKAIAAQAAAAIENARLREEADAAAETEKQVHLAADVQQRMIPRSPPKVEGLDIHSVYVPCYTLGGDLYDFIELPYDNIGLVIADVSGKGVPASLVMASVRAALRAQVDNVYYLYEVVQRLNRMLCRDTTPSEFVTLFYGVLDARNRRLTYCNAGHPPGLLLRGGEVAELHAGDMVLGVDPHQEYSQSILELQTGDTLLLYTDGVMDAMNFQQETFGRQRVIDALRRGGWTAAEVAQNLLWDVRRFVGMAKQSDDLTILVVRVP